MASLDDKEINNNVYGADNASMEWLSWHSCFYFFINGYIPISLAVSVYEWHISGTAYFTSVISLPTSQVGTLVILISCLGVVSYGDPIKNMIIWGTLDVYNRTMCTMVQCLSSAYLTFSMPCFHIRYLTRGAFSAQPFYVIIFVNIRHYTYFKLNSD